MVEISSIPAQLKPGISPELWEEAGWLGCNLIVELPVHDFSVRDLLQLSLGSIVETQWKSGEDMPVRANRRQIGWVEVETLGNSLAFRLTELI